jgi:TRAP transporter TatT component family protein
MARTDIIRATSLGLALCLLPACSLRRMAGKTIADSLAHGSSTYARDDDPELVREALPFGLKTLEGLATDLPRHRPLLRSLASGFTSYAVAYVIPESERLEAVDVLAARAERDRARRLLLRGRDYGLRALEVRHPSFGAALRTNADDAVRQTTIDDLPDLYWTAAAWGSAISVGKGDMDLVADVPIVERLIRRAEALDETWDEGSIHEFLITFESRGAAMGGSLVRARQHYERAMALNRGRRVGPLVALAEQVALQEQNRDEFDTLITRALAFDVNQAPSSRLANILAQRRARRLQEAADELFLKEQL